MTNTPVVLIAYLLDKSGSMFDIRDATISSTNEFIASQNPDNNNLLEKKDTYIGVCCFSNSDNITWLDKNKFEHINNFTPLTTEHYQPIGTTALYDSILTVIECCDQYIKNNQHQDVQVIIVIQTDGEENSSKRCTATTVKTLISARKEIGWNFTFLGANQDACLTAQNMGIDRGSAIKYCSTNDGSILAASALSNALSRLRSSDQAHRTPNIVFTDNERCSQFHR